MERDRQPPLNADSLSEKQKMISGLVFDRNDPELKQERQDCSRATYRFNRNAADPDNLSEAARREQFGQVLGSNRQDGNENASRRVPSQSNRRIVSNLGLRVEIDAPFNCEYGYNISIGDDVEIGQNCRIMDSGHVEIGARCIIGPNVTILTLDGEHHTQPIEGQKRQFKAKPVVIGQDVFIGASVIILQGVSIHRGATIEAGSVVSRDVTLPIDTSEQSIRSSTAQISTAAESSGYFQLCHR